MPSPEQHSIKDRLLALTHEDEVAKSDALKMYGIFPILSLLFLPLALPLLLWTKNKANEHQNSKFHDHFIKFNQSVMYSVMAWIVSFLVGVLVEEVFGYIAFMISLVWLLYRLIKGAYRAYNDKAYC